MLSDDRSRAESFGADPERYDRARPSYPPDLVDAVVVDPAPVGRARRALDVGCGTGIVSRLLTDRGCDVLGIEVDPRMAAWARARGLAVEEGRFEDWDAGGRRFDLLVSGQAWHWVDPVSGARKAADVLVPGGRVALFWNVGRPPADVRRLFDAVYRRLAPALDEHSVLLGSLSQERFGGTRDVLAATGFGAVRVLRFPWTRRYTTGEWLDVLPTHSDHAALPRERLDALLAGIGRVLDAAGGRFEMTYDAVLVTARRPPD